MTGQSGARSSKPVKAPGRKAAPKAEQDDAVTPPAAPEPAPAEPAVRRAGGWIDRGDGRGWELEE